MFGNGHRHRPNHGGKYQRWRRWLHKTSPSESCCRSSLAHHQHRGCGLRRAAPSAKAGGDTCPASTSWAGCQPPCWAGGLRRGPRNKTWPDQGIFVARQSFDALGGYAQIPLMEDLQLCKRLKSLARPRCLRPPLLTSSRRWEQNGIVRTVLLMWRLRLAYYCGVSPAKLARQYRRGSWL